MSIYERQDVQMSWAIGVSLFIIIFFCGLIGISGWYFRKNIKQQILAYEAYTLPSETKDPRPGAWTADDLKKYRNEEETRLKDYAWIDNSKTEAVVPIDRAIDLAIEHGIFNDRRGGTDAR